MDEPLLQKCRTTVLANGVAVVSSTISDAQSVSIGLWVGCGGRFENVREGGMSHFLEHMLFKGTPTRSALEISQAIEGRGGYLNAFTGADSTCYYVRMPYEYMSLAVDVLADMFLNATIPADEFERERDVIIEEIKMYDDQPQQVVQENFEKALYVGHPLGASLAGEPERLKAMTPEMLLAFKAKHYVPGATVFAFSGRLDHDACVAAVEKAVGHMRKARVPAFRRVDASVRQRRIVIERKDIAQTQAVLGFRVFGRHDDRREVMRVLSGLLGDNMSSRLFQTVRERHGLCYSIQSCYQLFEETGMFTISVGTDPKRAASALRLTAKELAKISDKPVGAGELKRAKDYLCGTCRLGLEGSSAQGQYLGDSYMGYGNIEDPRVSLARIRAVTSADVQRLAQELFEPSKLTLSLVVPKNDATTEDVWLESLQAL